MGSRASTFLYCASAVNCFLGLAYCAVPLYKLFCNASGSNGKIDVQKQHGKQKVEQNTKSITVKFGATKSSDLSWEFSPIQRSIKVNPGETVLAFYKARNISDSEVAGISTYSIIPQRLAPYLNKIQCFCFEKQFLGPREEVEMPVYFFIDEDIFDHFPETTEILLSYNFFKSQ